MVTSLVNASVDLAAAVAAGLGIGVPKALPNALARPVAPEIMRSAALSLTALPGDGGIRTRKVAILARGASKVLLVSAGVSTTLPPGESDPGILLASASKGVAAAFLAAVGKHRHTKREAALLRS